MRHDPRRSQVEADLQKKLRMLNATSKRLLLEAFGPNALIFVRSLCHWGIGKPPDTFSFTLLSFDHRSMRREAVAELA